MGEFREMRNRSHHQSAAAGKSVLYGTVKTKRFQQRFPL
jgi:hypothetical protein